MSVLHFRSLGQSWLDKKDPVVLKPPTTRLWEVGHIFEDSHVTTRLFAHQLEGQHCCEWEGLQAPWFRTKYFYGFLSFMIIGALRLLFEFKDIFSDLVFLTICVLSSPFLLSDFLGRKARLILAVSLPKIVPQGLSLRECVILIWKINLRFFLKWIFLSFFFFLHKSCVWGEMAQQLRILAALTECQSLVLRTHVEGLTGPVTAAPRDPRSPSGLCGQLHTGVHTHIHVHLHK